MKAGHMLDTDESGNRMSILPSKQRPKEFSSGDVKKKKPSAKKTNVEKKATTQFKEGEQ